ncbi:7057_t:CDS:2 [Funneliformis mosseae]|uniref:7057_t:CDS:1 n=1 Tax=Funneliformis mosseae TaxID=27381 RepID=A0A9N9AWN8_FUNMO|nr:7057_t:CDS:2 [Funneliformis mosseae]
MQAFIKLMVKIATKSRDRESLEKLVSCGKFYEDGIRVPADMRKALKIYKVAAKLGDSYSQYKVGVYYEVQQDLNKAIYWLEKSALQGHSDAETRLLFTGVEIRSLYKDKYISSVPVAKVAHFTLTKI